MQLIKLVFESLCRALIRFFDNRSVRNDDVEWYRMELDKRSAETQRIIDQLLLPRTITPTVDEEVNFQPVNSSKFTSWASKRRQLEHESYLKAQKLVEEAEVALNRRKSTDQLEQELLEDNG